jgi:hypothetical protein
MGRSELLAPVLLAGLIATSPLRAGDREFKQVVRDFQTQCHRAPMGGGWLGWLARCFSPRGVSGLRLAIFDDPEASRQILAADFEGRVRRTVEGSGMAPLIRSYSRSQGERTFIYARPEGRKAELLSVTAAPREVGVVSLKLDPETFRTWMDDPERMGRRACGRNAPGSGTPPPPETGADPESAGMR